MSKKKQKSIEELLEEALVPEEEQPYPVPENWVWVNCGAIAEIVRGVSYKKDQVEQFKNANTSLVIRGGNIQEGKLVNQDDNVYVKNDIINENQRLQEKDVLLVSSTGSNKVIGKAASVTPEFVNESFGAFVTLLRPDKKINGDYFGFYFQSSSYKSVISNLAKGSNIKNIKKEHLQNLSFPLPPLNEQKRIAEKVERLFAKIDEAKRLIEEVKESFEFRRAAIFDKAFKGQLGTNDPNEKSMLETSNEIKEKDLIPKEEQPYEVPENWVWVRSGHVAKWGSGGTPSRKRLEYYGGDIPWIKTGELNDGIVSTSEETITEEGLQNSSAKIFPKGSIVIAMYGATIGKLGILGIDAATNQACAVGQPYDFLNSKYMFYYFLARRSDLIVLGKGGAQPNISQTIIKDFPFALPPLNEQKRIADKVDNLLSNLENEQELVLEVEEKLNLLKQSILNKAFRGELGTNDPNDEQAIELLKEVLKSK